MYEPKHRQELLARLKRRKLYRQKPDLPGMTKRIRLRGYPLAYSLTRRMTTASKRLAVINGALIRCRRKPAKRPPPPKRELVPRPKQPAQNKRLYRRQAEHARGTFGCDGVGLLRQFYDLYCDGTYR